ncbi:hypothetical protein STEG23_028388 [Scotinomys teguina]
MNPTQTRHPQKSDSLVVCEVDPELKEKLRKFRFRKETNNAAIIMKVDKDRQMVVLEEEFQNISPEELRLELPERQPRFVVYSYKYSHADGRVSYPLCFIFSSPVGTGPGPDSLKRDEETEIQRGSDTCPRSHS